MLSLPLLFSSLLLSAATAADSVVVFNEINYHPTDPAEALEWVELHNQNAVNVDLSGWRLSGGVDFTFPAGTVILGKGYLLVAKTPGLVAGAFGPFSGALDNSGDTLKLRNNSDRLMDELKYGTHGDWPISPDGSGTTLAKLNPNLASDRAVSWAASSTVGGTPGSRNFLAPGATIKSTAVSLVSAWKYQATGIYPGPTWNLPGFDDSLWPSGNAAFSFGGGSMYEDPPPAGSSNGSWAMERWTSDADSQVSAAKTYTHKVDLGKVGAFTVVNGVNFDYQSATTIRSGGLTVPTAAETSKPWTLLGHTATYTTNAGSPRNLMPAGSGSNTLLKDFYYGSGNTTETITLSGLTAGQTNILTLYATGWDTREFRKVRVNTSNNNASINLDEGPWGQGKGTLFKYTYIVPASGTLTVTITGINTATPASWHNYAFSNEVAATPLPLEASVTPVAVTEVSSEVVTGGLTRGAVNTISGSGLDAFGDHGTVADGNHWLANGTTYTPNDPLPSQITYDLGAAQNLHGMRIWNYNELLNPTATVTDYTTRGVKNVEVLVSPDVAGETFTSAGNYTINQAFGVTNEIGQRLDFPSLQTGVRRVRLNIGSNWGAAGDLVGLAEVRFLKPTAANTTPVPAREKVESLYNTGVTNSGSVAAYNTADAHWKLTATSLALQAYTPSVALPSPVAVGNPVIVSSPHTAWMQADGVSNFTGFSGVGTDSVPFGQFTFSTSFDLTNYYPATLSLQAYTAVDNVLDYFKLNGTAQATLAAAGFASYLGPFAVTGPFNPGLNTLDAVWTNSGTAIGAGALRLKFDARAQRRPGVTLATNPTTIWFRKKFTLTGTANSQFSVLLRHALDDGAVFYLNGQEFSRVNMPAGPISETTLASADLVYPRLSLPIALPTSGLVLGENTLAVELHQSAAATADAFFDAALEVMDSPAPPSVSLSEIGGNFVELSNTATTPVTLAGYALVNAGGGSADLSALSIPAHGFLSLSPTTLGFSWLDGDRIFLMGPDGTVPDALVVKSRPQARDGLTWRTPNAATPGAANSFSVPDSIVINEIMYKHAPVFLPTGKTANPEQWLELHNKSAAAVNLAGWSLSGGVRYTFSNVNATSIPAGGFLVIAKDRLALAAKYPALNIVGNFSGNLGSEDTLRLEDANSNVVDEVTWFGGGRWDDRANGGGSSLELKDPRADNTQPEAWAASDESAKSTWQNYEIQGLGAPTIVDGATVREPTTYNEFIMGLLAKGEYLIDDISVVLDPLGASPLELIQNGGFEGNTAAAWRLLGTHGAHSQSVVVPDPASPDQKVLKVVASDSAEHMHNHCETTLKNGAIIHPLSATSTYRIRFRARWVSGSPRLNTRLYFNRLARQWLLPMPENTGTPGQANSRAVANAGPTFSGLAHAPVLPAAGETARVTVKISDPDGLGTAAVKWRLDPAITWATLPMTSQGGGIFSANIPAQNFGALVQFYVEAADAAATPATAVFPAAGAKSGAYIRWNDGYAPTTPGHEFRFLMSQADADFMHSTTQGMSNHFLPATLVYQGSEVFYDIGARTKSSERGRLVATRLGFALSFDDMQKFRGVNGSVNLDRSGLGIAAGGGSYGHGEIISWQYINRAGNIPSMYNDMVYVVAPRTAQLGSAMLTMAEFNDNYLDGQFDNGASGAVHKLDFIYYPTTTDTGTPEGLKIATPDAVIGVSIPMLNAPADKEAYRWNFLVGNAGGADNYQGIINMNQALRVPAGPAFVAAISAAVDVDEYLRTSAAMAFTNATDHYSAAGSGQAHNLKLYTRPSDGRVLYLPWDHDYQSLNAVGGATATSAIINNGDLSKIIAANPAWERAFWGHLHDIMTRSFNRAYMDSWIDHYATFSTTGGVYANYKTWIDARRTQVLAQCATTVPAVAFAITTNGGADFSDTNPLATLSGTAWLDVLNLRLAGGTETLPVTWTAKNTWQIRLPLHTGPNAFTIEGLGYDGLPVPGATDSIVIIGTGNIVPADAGNTVISELNYHPADAVTTAKFPTTDDFEWIEIRNISTKTIELQNCHFDSGITYTFAASTLVPPGGVLVLPRRSAAFALTHPGTPAAPEYFLPTDPTGNQFSNGGEEIGLVDAAGRDIKRFTYDDAAPWPAEADGHGQTLVLISPFSNPPHGDPLSWRASSNAEGTPGTEDGTAFAGEPTGDANGNGIEDLTDFAIGSGALPTATLSAEPEPVFTFTLERDPTAQTRHTVEMSTDLTPNGTPGSWNPVPAPALVLRETLSPTLERLTYAIPVPPSSSRVFIRGRFSAP